MIELPRSFLEMPRWWTEGADWLAALPGAIEQQCARRGLTIAGPLAHGSNAVVVPVERGSERFALRMAPPGDEVAEQTTALRWWDGRGTVRLYDADVARGAMLLELLGEPLDERPIGEAVEVLGGLMRRLGVEGPADALSTQEIVQARAAVMEGQIAGQIGAVQRPRIEAVPLPYLRAALAVADELVSSSATAAVNGDLHSAQVLRGDREPWLVVDPVLYRGDIEFDLGRILWTRLDEMAGDAEIRRCFDTVVRAAGLDHSYARDWVIFRTVDYWLWGLSVGLTTDPVRCQRLLDAMSR
ncbi:aminoglycoside phosphotransferase family protein [Kribbella sp. NPDC051770]|uniref:aminoglycoside phosphotransferase family protein n=1 Tax=Kribbella sp. NPDC051770 TaxID=3155413 RepID=UPI00342B3536